MDEFIEKNEAAANAYQKLGNLELDAVVQTLAGFGLIVFPHTHTQ